MIKSSSPKYLPLIFIPFINLILVGCSSKTAILMDRYDGQKNYDKNITIIKLFDKPILGDPNDITDYLGKGAPDSVYTSFFNVKFPEAFRKSNSFNNVYYVDNYSHADLKERILDINDMEKMKILLPKENNTLDIDSAKSDFILFIDKLKIGRLNMGPGINMGEIIHQLNFAIWDNNKGEIVSYGRVEYESGPGALSKDYIDHIYHHIAAKILGYSPFPMVNEYY
jgi:hypothetical protein